MLLRKSRELLILLPPAIPPVEFGGDGDIRDNDNISSGGSDNPSSENTGNENTDTKEESEVNNE